MLSKQCAWHWGPAHKTLTLNSVRVQNVSMALHFLVVFYLLIVNLRIFHLMLHYTFTEYDNMLTYTNCLCLIMPIAYDCVSKQLLCILIRFKDLLTIKQLQILVPSKIILFLSIKTRMNIKRRNTFKHESWRLYVEVNLKHYNLLPPILDLI